MKKILFLVITLAVMAFAYPHTATAQNANCAPRDFVIERLSAPIGAIDGVTSFGESRKSVGLGADNTVVEVWGNTETGTWTITVTLPIGMMCVAASGSGFEDIGDEPEVDPARYDQAL